MRGVGGRDADSEEPGQELEGQLALGSRLSERGGWL